MEQNAARQKEMIENLTAELKLTLESLAEGNRELIKRSKVVERLSRDNAQRVAEGGDHSAHV